MPSRPSPLPTRAGYFALGVPEALEGARRLSGLLGIALEASPQPGPDQWAWRTPLGHDDFWVSEMVAPNPRFRGRHPLHLSLTEGPPLQTLCWAMGATDFGEISARANRLKRSFSWLEPLHNAEEGPVLGFIGPGLRTDLPGFLFNDIPVARTLHAVEIIAVSGIIEDAVAHRAAFEKLGIEADLVEGDPEIRAVLRGPKGTLTLSSPPVAFGGNAAR